MVEYVDSGSHYAKATRDTASRGLNACPAQFLSQIGSNCRACPA